MKNPEKLWQVILKVGILFIATFFVYFAVATKWTFVITQDLDYFNLQAQAFLQGRLDLPNPIFTDELSPYRGKWYLYYGPLPAIPLALAQLLTGRIFIPTVYLNLLTASLNVCLIYLLIRQIRRDFFPRASSWMTILATILFAFGTVHFWLGVRSGIWFVAQIHSFFLNSLGLVFVLKKKRRLLDYFLCSFFISLNFFGRIYTVFLLIIPLLLFYFEHPHQIIPFLKKTAIIFSPAVIFFIFFLTYNQMRFDSPLETGYNFQKFHYHYLRRVNEAGGWFHPGNIPENLWFMTIETPTLTLTEKREVKFIYNPEGNSIFYLTPPFLAIFAVSPLKRLGKKLSVDPLIFSLWVGLLVTLIPILLLSGTGWQQFGYRYSLDIMIPLLLLCLFAIKMRVNILFFLGTLFAVFVQTWGALYA